MSVINETLKEAQKGRDVQPQGSGPSAPGSRAKLAWIPAAVLGLLLTLVFALYLGERQAAGQKAGELSRLQTEAESFRAQISDLSEQSDTLSAELESRILTRARRLKLVYEETRMLRGQEALLLADITDKDARIAELSELVGQLESRKLELEKALRELSPAPPST